MWWYFQTRTTKITTIYSMSTRSKRNRSRLYSIRHHGLVRWLDAKFIHRPRIYIPVAIGGPGACRNIDCRRSNHKRCCRDRGGYRKLSRYPIFVPHSVASKPFRIIGGHISAILAALCTVGIMMLLPDTVASNQWVVHTLQGASLALVILFMTITNTEHAPAAGTALGLAASVPGNSVVSIVSAAIIISIVRTVLYKRLHNLM